MNHNSILWFCVGSSFGWPIVQLTNTNSHSSDEIIDGYCIVYGCQCVTKLPIGRWLIEYIRVFVANVHVLDLTNFICRSRKMILCSEWKQIIRKKMRIRLSKTHYITQSPIKSTICVSWIQTPVAPILFVN